MKFRIAAWLFALALAVAFCLLGRWQLNKAVIKQGMLDRVAAVLRDKQAQSLAVLSRTDDTRYAWVAGTGHFADAPALLLDNQRRGDAVGVMVFQVFQPDQGRALLVELGWLPLPGNRTLPAVTRPDGTLRLSGLLTSPPSAGFALGPAYVVRDPQRWLLTRVDLGALATGLKTDLSPQVLRLDPTLPLGYPRDLDVLPNTLPPQQHRAYAVQWFGLALATLVTALVLTLRRKKK
jgi:cytochrome oxidase assembly protein ShyY1